MFKRALPALALAASVLAVGSGAAPAAALTDCRPFWASSPGYTSGVCNGAGGTYFMFVSHTCLLSNGAQVYQKGNTVSQGVPSHAGPCNGTKYNRRYNQTNG